MKDTALGWLLKNLISEPYSEEDFEHNKRCWEQAKEMERQQIIETYIAGSFTGCGCYDYMEEEDGELYYNETFKSE